MNAEMNGKNKLESEGDGKTKKEFMNIKGFWDTCNKKQKTYVNTKRNEETS